ncbi:MAG: serine/threonine protein kinase, partial [Pirellulales bacterium]|nr:serine/threonine protein kinase [Pirellulales bacterium]
MATDRDDWMRMQKLFEEALALPVAVVDEYLDQACQGNQKLRDDVRDLLDAYQPAEAELEQAPIESITRASNTRAISQVDGYELLQQVHCGGQGTVYRAIQLSTKREVAVKFMLAGHFADEASKRRFEREVELVSGLRHPGIVPIFDSGLANDQYFYAMEYVDGIRLDQFVRQQELTFREILLLLVEVCEAVNHAQQHGVIHRDLKPSNILVDKYGKPRILDFGLAKSVRAEVETRQTVSMTGQVVGTLAYMSPEQAAGLHSEVDIRTDVYSLGVVLYEMLTGELPYLLDFSLAENLSAIKNTQPNLQPLKKNRVDNEVSTILLKALQKEKDRRYRTAGAMGDDLSRYLRGELIEAKRDSTLYVLQKLLRRNFKTACACAAFLALIVISSVGLFGLYLSASQARDRADRHANLYEAQRDEIQLLRDESLAQLYVAEMNLAGEALGQAGGIYRVEELIGHWAGNDHPAVSHGWEWHYLRSRCDREYRILNHSAEIRCVQWHPTENRVAFGDWDGFVWTWDLEGEPEKVGKLKRLVRAVVWNEDGTRIAAGATTGGIKVWNVEDRREIFQLPGIKDVLDLAWRPGQPDQLACSTGTGLVEVWGIDVNEKVAFFNVNPGVQTVDWDHEGKLLAMSCHDHYLRVFDVDEQRQVEESGKFENPVFSAFWQPEERRIAYCTTSGLIGLSDDLRSNLHWSSKLDRSVWRLDWDARGQRLASVGADRTLRVWAFGSDFSQGDLMERFDSHGGQIWGLDWNHDSDMIATSALDRTIRIWKTNDQLGDRALIIPAELMVNELTALAWSPDGKTIAIGSVDMLLHLWNLQDNSLASHEL